MAHVVCIGSMLVDELYFSSDHILPETSNPATVVKSAGGVMFNVARNLSLLQVDVRFIASIGSDTDANYLTSQLHACGISSENLISSNAPTGKYVSFLQPDGSLFAAACADAATSAITKEVLVDKSELLLSASLILADTNLELSTLSWLIEFCRLHNKLLIVEPVSVSKAGKLSAVSLDGIFMITPNEDEVKALSGLHENLLSVTQLQNRGAKMIWVRKGKEGSTLFQKSEMLDIPVPEITVVDSTGAGDAALAGWVAAYLDGRSLEECVKTGHAIAMETLQCRGSVNDNISKDKLYSLLRKYYAV